jgi:protein-disulfide isomerase
METQKPPQLTYQEKRELRLQKKIAEQRKRKLKRISRRILVWLLVLGAIGGAIFGMVKLVSRQQNTGPAVTVDAISQEDWVKGNRGAKVVLIEYSDFQCPACAFYYPLLKKLSEEFGDKLALVYRHFPLISIHPNAKPAAFAAEAAGKQGKFWEMHNLIFENQSEWKDKRKPDEIFTNYAQRLNLNIDQFKTDLASKEIRQKVENAYQNAVRLGLNSTPTFFLNGKKLTNPRNYDDFKNLILQAINANDGQ